MIVLALVAVALAALFYYFLIKPFTYWTDRGVKQGDKKAILDDSWGAVTGRKDVAEMVEGVYKRFPTARYSGSFQFFTPTLVVRDPDLIKKITVKDFDHFTDHTTFIPEDSDPLWGKNLFALKGQRWRDMRTILSPTFTSSKMRSIFVLITECAENFVQHFLNKNEKVVTIEFKDTFTRFTNDVIATTAFGIKVDSLGQPNNDFYLMGKEATDFGGFWSIMRIFGYTMFPKLYKVLKIRLFSEQVSNFFCSVVSETIKTREEKGIVRPDMINLLLEARRGVQRHEESDVIDTGFSTAQETETVPGKTKPAKELSDMDLSAQAMIFFFAGFETVSSLMCFMAYELATNPEIQDRLRQEVRSTMDECKGKLTYEDLLKMKYMDMVVSEALRKWPVALAMDRICTKPYTIEPITSDEKPVHLKPGDMLSIPTYGLHHDPQYFPNPERFDPERFNDENKDNIKPYTYSAFGLGPRNCVGSRFALLEIKTVFFYTLKSFEIIPVQKSRIPLQLAKKKLNVIAEGGFWFGLKRIEKNDSYRNGIKNTST